MPNLRVHSVGVALDGYAAGSKLNRLGEGGERLHGLGAGEPVFDDSTRHYECVEFLPSTSVARVVLAKTR